MYIILCETDQHFKFDKYAYILNNSCYVIIFITILANKPCRCRNNSFTVPNS